MIGEEGVARAISEASVDTWPTEWEALPETKKLGLEYRIGLARAAISAHLAALERAGWKCVPVAATNEMWAAGQECISEDLPDCEPNAMSIWNAMIEAAPK
jgi:hypothetical protein